MADLIGTPVLVLALANPSAPTVEQRGDPATTHYSYVCVGFNGPGHTAASPPTTITTGPLSLSVHNSLLITPPNDPHVDYWEIYRIAGSTTQGFIGQVVPSIIDDVQISGLLDYGLVADGRTAPTQNTSGQLYVNVTGQHNLLTIGVDGQVQTLGPGLEGQGVIMAGGVPGWHDVGTGFDLIRWFTATPTVDELPVGFVGISVVTGVVSLHINVSGSILTLALGVPA
jgi:hypothetical protein